MSQHTPGDGVRVKEVAEQAGHVPELVRLEPVNGVVRIAEDLLEWVLVLAVDHAEALWGKKGGG